MFSKQLIREDLLIARQRASDACQVNDLQEPVERLNLTFSHKDQWWLVPLQVIPYLSVQWPIDHRLARSGTAERPGERASELYLRTSSGATTGANSYVKRLF